jgi:hypothetical protein
MTLRTSILFKEHKFNGGNLLKWNITMTQLLGLRGLTGYIDRNIPKPVAPTESATSTPDPTPIYSTRPSYNEWVFCDQFA